MTAPRLLIVEDDTEIAGFLAAGLSAEGYEVTVRSEGAGLLDTVRDGSFSAVILDRMLPDAEGADLCQKLRAAGEDVMILMLTAKDALDDKLEGLRAGADDYMTKPFAFEELLVRLEVLLRHANRSQPVQEEISVGDIRLDLPRKVAYYRDAELGLTATEFALLIYFAENAGRVVSRPDILRAVWGYDFDPHTNIVEVYVAYLRRKLDRAGAEGALRTVRGFGYVLTSEDGGTKASS
ncbi:response regulator transcription factor [Marivita sp. GX14005]|uniref:response regulator transcription factor n=1 Tax=Marivita sp. GX14005 TaxID=2942276 RepID=UPI0020189103|nr:response regulator transcription factor [Marivita sp. GX14005]MCL3883143.1 response regulator transcription factor [Marivita sp. GX14005]